MSHSADELATNFFFVKLLKMRALNLSISFSVLEGSTLDSLRAGLILILWPSQMFRIMEEKA